MEGQEGDELYPIAVLIDELKVRTSFEQARHIEQSKLIRAIA